MSKRKRKLTKAEKQAKKERREQYEWIFVRGKQKKVRRPPTIDGISVDDFIRQNADPIWLHQEGLWEYMEDDFGQEDEPGFEELGRDSQFEELPASQSERAGWVAEQLCPEGREIRGLDVLHALASLGLKLEPDENGLASLEYLDRQQVEDDLRALEIDGAAHPARRRRRRRSVR